MINPELELRLEIEPPIARWKVPPDLSYLCGHFPGFPVLPGVAMIDVSLEVLRRLEGMSSIRLATLRNAKFARPVHPGQVVEIRMTPQTEPAGSRADWIVQWEGVTDSGGRESVAELALRLRLGG